MIETPHAQDARRRRPGLLALQRDARADRRDAARHRRAGDRSAGRRHPRLHLHLHDGELHARRRAARRPRRRLRSPEPDRRRSRSKGALAQTGCVVVRRAVPDSDAPRHDDRRARRACSTRTSASARRSTSSRSTAGSAAMYFDEPGLPWVMPSPNIPTLDSAIVYPGAVLFEGTMLSEGRGTTRPFELIGAPWIDGDALAAAMNARGLPGVHFRAGVLRADVPEAREADLRRLPAARDRPRGVPARARRGRTDRRIPPPERRALRLAAAALRVRARQGADRHPVRIRSPADDASTPAATSRRWSRRGATRKRRSGGRGSSI